MSRQFIRIKQDGACVIMLDVNTITATYITYDHNVGAYKLIVCSNGSHFMFTHGGLDVCHYALNQINSLLNIDIIDLV